MNLKLIGSKLLSVLKSVGASILRQTAEDALRQAADKAATQLESIPVKERNQQK
jgi:hypothetical protein